MRAQSLGQEEPFQKEMATHSSILAWKVPWTEEAGRLQSMESQRVGQDLVTEHARTQRAKKISHLFFHNVFRLLPIPGKYPGCRVN